MRDIAVVMPTVDRHPRTSYLAETLANLKRSGIWTSDRLHSLHVVDSGIVVDGVEAWPDRAIIDTAYTDRVADWNGRDKVLLVHRAEERRLPTLTVAAALRAGGQTDAEWVLFLEDDIDVCADFLDGVGAWLDRYARKDRPINFFACANDAVAAAVLKGLDVWDYAVTSMWGTYALALRSEHARDLADWLDEHPLWKHDNGREATAYDFEINRWARTRGYTHYLTSCPSFVQHVGFDSVINEGRDWHPTMKSWPGQHYSYFQKQQQQQGATRR